MDFDKLNLPDSIEEFFSKEEYANMCDMEKRHFKNIRLNYQMMLHFGLPAQKPDFMKPNWGIKKQAAAQASNSDTDEEWRPRPKRSKKWCPPKPAVTKPALKDTPKKCDSQKGRASDAKQSRRQRSEKPTEEPRSYSLRKRKETNYMKLEGPNDDEFVYCEECHQEHEGDCPEHGPLFVVHDTQVPVTKRGGAQRALKTLPPGLEVKQSSIPDAGLGVFATNFFPLRTRFGPYQGRRVTDPDIAHASGYCWQISTDDRSSHFVDAKDCRTANWMRYVNCARTTAEQNVTAYQHCGEVYYRAHTNIPAGAEILVWYGREYGKELGIIRDDEPDHKGRRPVTQTAEPKQEQSAFDSLTFSDIATSDIGFTDSTDSDSHRKRRKKTTKTRVPTKHAALGHQTALSSTSDRQTAVSTPLSQDRPHVCRLCAADFVQFSSLRIHMASAHGQKLLAVPPESRTPGNHGDRNDGNTNRRHVCDVYNKAFTRAGDLEGHKRIHTGERPFVCDVCNKAFTQAGHLKGHKRIHTGERPYKCQHCDAAFGRSDPLQAHIRSVHARDKPYMCDVCGAAFSRTGILHQHKRIHTGERPYVCDVCGAAFSQTVNLHQHKRIHTGERPYVCQDCGKAFNHSSHLTRHHRTHTGEKPYRCPHCPGAFTESGKLKKHVKRLHQ